MSNTALAASAPAIAKKPGGIGRARELGIFAALVLVVVAATVKNPNFLFSTDGWRDLLLTPSILVLVAVGQAIVIITRNVDLSVGSIMGLTAFLTGRLFIDIPGIPIPLVVIAAVIFGALLGLVNGALVAFAKVPAMVITLGTLYAYRGINVLWTGSDQVHPSDLPKDFLRLGTQQILTIPVLSIVAIIVLALAAWYMRNTRGGREYYAIGSDPAAAELYGLKTTRRVLSAFVLSGALAGLAGVFYVTRYGSVSSQVGSGWELDAVGAAVIGGIAITGGVGSVWGAAIGAMLLMTINRALPILGIPDFWQRAVVGVLIIGAIVLDRLLAVRQRRQLIEARDES
ncbi:ABC transporter permease [Microbacterium sp. MYb66]|jgi:rhamnose transport system permease protein|uniref:ABC transporter permease n=1 Tax=Microbacterium sp. MYb66 TaxID=1848692 RepID=UPI000CFFC680|nr:ABC transporter permease [Microbacterium sp. MYb66]PRA82202.1 ATPase [Microbacterium sp. MYb66]